MPPTQPKNRPAPDALAAMIRAWSAELGFQQTGFTVPDVGTDADYLHTWLANGYHGEMGYMERHGGLRTDPAALLPGTLSIISVRMDYLPQESDPPEQLLEQPDRAYVSRYALGRDYHKVLRKRLQRLADRIETTWGEFGYRAFTDSAPLLEKALARNAGLGWIGKHTNLINRDAGSWFFLGELLTNLPLPADASATEHCGTCTACIDVCPTNAIIGPHQLDARRCISYLTIELRGSIPEEYRPLIGNRIYGCDDCQLFCPWNKFAKPTREDNFAPRHGLESALLTELFGWSEQEWQSRMAGSAIYRIGYEQWLRNIAVALGNAPTNAAVLAALRARADHPSELLREHVAWALAQHEPANQQHA